MADLIELGEVMCIDALHRNEVRMDILEDFQTQEVKH